MGIINEEMRQELLKKTPLPKRKLLDSQINVITKTIEDYAIKYKYSKDFREGLDLILTDILNGKYLGD